MSTLFGKGIVIPVPQKYQQLCLQNVTNLRLLGCTLPIELWEIGSEISEEYRSAFAQVKGVTFKNVEAFTDEPNHWKGFQVKAFIISYTNFKEVLLCDADVIIHQNPEMLFEDEHYLQTGAYFFRDLEKWKFKRLTNPLAQYLQRFKYNKFTSVAFFQARKKWLLNLMPKKSSSFPIEWAYVYEPSLPKKPVKEALQESGLVLMDKEKHSLSIEFIYTLNYHHKETYKHVWGDKETFWIGCVMAKQPFYFNSTSAYRSKDKRLCHNYKGKLFFTQKG